MATTSSPRKLHEEISPHLETASIRIKGILAATDFSKQATLALKIAARLAKQFRSRLHVLYCESPQIYAPAGMLTPVLQEIDIERVRKQLHEYTVQIPEVRTTRHEEIVLCGPAPEAIYDLVENKGIDLVVMGSHGRSGLGKVVLGSVAESTIRRLHCPVLVAGPNCTSRHNPLRSMILATNLPAGSLRAVQYATSIAWESGATLKVVHVLPVHAKGLGELGITAENNATAELHQLIPRNTEWQKRVHFEIVTGNAAEEIIRVAKSGKAGLIVMGVREHAAMASHAPSTTLSEVIRMSRCPVLAVQPHLV